MDGVLGFENDEYVIGAFGLDDPTHEYEIINATDLNDGTIKIQFIDTATAVAGRNAGNIESTQKIECVFKKAPESKWGYNFISCKVIEADYTR